MPETLNPSQKSSKQILHSFLEQELSISGGSMDSLVGTIVMTRTIGNMVQQIMFWWYMLEAKESICQLWLDPRSVELGVYQRIYCAGL